MTVKKLDYAVIAFKKQSDWETWLDKNHANRDGVWVRMYKKASGKPTVTYEEALDIALCYGWIDGLVNKYDEESYIQKFTPRRARSKWSKINKNNVERLIKAGKMKPAGQAQIDAAKKDGRWDAAYDSPATMQLPEDFLQLVKKNKKAQTFLETLNKTNTYAIAYRLNDAKKPETRERRIKKFLEMLEKGEKLY